MGSKIVVVEDELIIAFDIKGLLEAEGYIVEIIVDFENPLEKIISCKPDLVLLDINLKSNIDGVKIAEELLKNDHIPFVFLTSYYDRVTLDRVKNTRPYGFITKPFKDVDLISTISIILNNFSHRKIDGTRENESISTEAPFFLKTVVTYINEHITEKIDNDTLVEISKWKYHHFIRIFNKYMGLTPYQYILAKKIEVAKTLLIETDTPTTQIGFDLSFESYGNFCNAFKKNVGVSPKQFRSRYLTQKYLQE